MASDKQISPPSLTIKMQIVNFIVNKYPKQQRWIEYTRENITKIFRGLKTFHAKGAWWWILSAWRNLEKTYRYWTRGTCRISFQCVWTPSLSSKVGAINHWTHRKDLLKSEITRNSLDGCCILRLLLTPPSHRPPRHVTNFRCRSL